MLRLILVVACLCAQTVNAADTPAPQPSAPSPQPPSDLVFVEAESKGVAFTATPVEDSERATKSFPFPIQTHRGAGLAMPENTLESFEWAWQHGVTPECDMRTTKDGTIVCFHDANLTRVPTGIDNRLQQLGIEKLSLAEVKKLDVGSFRGSQYAGQRIPTLASVLSAMRGHPERALYLDFKHVDLDELASLVHKYGVERQAIFTATRYALIRRWKERVPESPTLCWNGGTEEELTKRVAELRKENFEGITYLQVHVHVGDLSSDEPFKPSSKFLQKLGQELKDRGIVFQVLPWECSDPRAYEKLLALGAESFATDYPEVTLEAVRSFRGKNRVGTP